MSVLVSALPMGLCSINQNQRHGPLRLLFYVLEFPLFAWIRLFHLGRHFRYAFQQQAQRGAFHGVIDILRQRAGSFQSGNVRELCFHDAHNVPVLVHKRPAGIARLDRHADLKLAWVILHSGQTADLAFGQFGGKTLQFDVWEADGKNRFAQLRPPTRHHR